MTTDDYCRLGAVEFLAGCFDEWEKKTVTEQQPQDRRSFIGVREDCFGWYAVHYDADIPVNGLEYYATRDEAVAEARNWAEADGYELEPGL